MSSPVEDVFTSFLERDVRFGYLDQRVSSPRENHPQVISNLGSATMLRALRTELRECDRFMFSVAFVSAGALALLKQEFVDFDKPGTIVTSNYLGFNQPAAFAELEALSRLGVDARFHSAEAYHPKGYVFFYPDRVTAILGSSNLTKAALTTNHEWNLKVSAAKGSDLATQLDSLIAGERLHSTSLTRQWVTEYADIYAKMPPAPRSPTMRIPGPVLVPSMPGEVDLVPAGGFLLPNLMQTEALGELALTRAAGARRAVIISATGTGKTVLSALDIKAAAPRKVLFVVHREQILDRAMEEFQSVLGVGPEVMGKLTGGQRQLDRSFVFATIQTLSRPDVLAGIAQDEFDYVLIDEVHRAGAASYERVLEHLKPEFLLGMTATPERTDGFNVFELFDYNVPYEIRLSRALEADMLCPFHYYGVADVEFDDGQVTSIDVGIDKLASRLRIEHIVEALETYGQAGVAARGLIFCSRTDEARELSTRLNEERVRDSTLRTLALTGQDSVDMREEAVRRLEAGELDYLITVDIFNEGVDIPSVNQIIMLRQTQSSIVFVQQLGRGLRKHPGKEYVVVIDFIGNYANNYLIPIALFGDESLNRESLRQHLISAEESGVIAGLSSIRFDRVAQARVLKSIAETSLDSMQNIRAAFMTLRNRLGRPPTLFDFHRFGSADPGIVATKVGTYQELVARFVGSGHGLSRDALHALALLSHEALLAKRPHEALVIRELLDRGDSTLSALLDRLREVVPSADEPDVVSALAPLTLDFGTKQEKVRYAHPVVIVDGDAVRPADAFASAYKNHREFREAVDDLLATSLAMIADRYDSTRPFSAGRQYSRKDVTRLLGWGKNMSSIIYGYKVHRATGTCPIFVTMHKSEATSASTAYEDALLDNNSMRWFTRSRRTLESDEVRAIVDNQVAIHVFAKKDDAEGSDFYYLGAARSEQAEQVSMPGNNGEPLNVVEMVLRFDSPIESAVYDYFHPVVTV